jgi:hypothetical protein
VGSNATALPLFVLRASFFFAWDFADTEMICSNSTNGGNLPTNAQELGTSVGGVSSLVVVEWIRLSRHWSALLDLPRRGDAPLIPLPSSQCNLR